MAAPGIYVMSPRLIKFIIIMWVSETGDDKADINCDPLDGGNDSPLVHQEGALANSCDCFSVFIQGHEIN